MTSRHEIEAAALAARLRRKNAAGGKRKLKVFARPPARKKSTAGRASRNAGSWKSKGKSPGTLIKVHKGGLAGVRYMHVSKGAKFLDSNMFGRDYRELEAEFDLDQARHPNVKNLFVHASISRPKGHDLTPEQWTQLLRDWLDEIGANGVNYTAVRHSNTDNDHIHVVFSRALPNGKLLNDSQNFYRWRAALRRAEEKNGLKSIDTETEAVSSQSDRQVNAVRRSIRRGTPINFIDPTIVVDCIGRSNNFESFSSELKRADIQVQISKRDNGDARGILFKKVGSDEYLAGSSISKNLTLPRIQAALKANNELNQRQQQMQAHRIQQQRMAALARANQPTIPRERG